MRQATMHRLALAALTIAMAAGPRAAQAGAPLFHADEIHLFDTVSRSGGTVVDFLHAGSLYALYVDRSGRAMLGRRSGFVDDGAPPLDDAPLALKRALSHRVAEMWRLSPAEARHYARVVRRQTQTRSQPSVVLMHRVFPRQATRLRRFAERLGGPSSAGRGAGPRSVRARRVARRR